MARPRSKIPTKAELEILGVLWDRGPSTVREVYDVLRVRRKVGHTTVLKLLQIMTEKAIVTSDRSVRPQVFRAMQSPDVVKNTALGDLVDRVFGGSAGKLMLQLLSSRSASKDELAEIRRMLDELEGHPRRTRP